MNEFIDMIKGRKSIRTFDGNTLSDEHRTDIEEYMKDISNPFGIPIEFMLLDATEHELSSPVLSGERLYVAGKVEKKSYADVAFGYSFEKLILHAWSLGVGSVWIGGTMKRKLFEKAVGLKSGEMMPWRIVYKDGAYHFYEKKDRGYNNDETGDLQKIDVGIALCHFVLGLEDKGKKAEIKIQDPEIKIPADVEYIVSVTEMEV